MKVTSTKPYLIRAIYDWCIDSGFSPYIVVRVDSKTEVPVEHIKDGEITLNISHTAANSLEIGNELIKFKARFDGNSKNIQIPISAIKGIFAKEINQGLSFSIANEENVDSSDQVIKVVEKKPATRKKKSSKRSKSHLQIVK